MKKLIILLALFMGIVAGSLAQGTIRFSTYDPVHGVDAPAGIGSCGFGIVTGMTAQLFLFTGSGLYTPLTPATKFYDDWTNLMRTRYVVVPNEPVVVPNIPAGQNATVVLRVFSGPSFEESTLRSESPPTTILLGGRMSDGTEIPPAPLVGLRGFELLVGCGAIIGVTREGNAELRLTLTTDYPNYVIEASDDLQTWQPVATNSSPTVIVPLGSSGMPRFFRPIGWMNPIP